MRPLLPLLPILLLTSCYKDEVDIASLTTNPFDADYGGQSAIVFDSTYLDAIVIGSPPTTINVQVVQVHVEEALLPAGAVYKLRFDDPDVSDAADVLPDPGTSVFRYFRMEAAPEPGVEKCFGVALLNDHSTAREETICCTL